MTAENGESQGPPEQGAPQQGSEQGDSGRWQAPDGSEGLAQEDVLEALKVVVDPELGINVVDLGLVYDVEIEDSTVRVHYTLTSMGCPVGPLIEQQIQQIVRAMPGVENVEGRLTFTPPWSPELMSEEARLAMGMF